MRILNLSEWVLMIGILVLFLWHGGAFL